MHSDRRAFLRQLGIATAAVGGGGAHSLGRQRDFLPRRSSAWDMSWIEQLQRAPYKAVFDSPALADGGALDLAAGILDNFADVYGANAGARMVIVMRQLGQVMAFSDDLWNRYAIGAERQIKDARGNPYTAQLESLRGRGAIFLVCNRASMNWASSAAERTHTDVEKVRADVRSGLVPGATLMPTGVFALVRAQNAGCAYMRGA